MDAVLQIAGGLEARARTHNVLKRDPVEPWGLLPPEIIVSCLTRDREKPRGRRTGQVQTLSYSLLYLYSYICVIFTYTTTISMLSSVMLYVVCSYQGELNNRRYGVALPFHFYSSSIFIYSSHSFANSFIFHLQRYLPIYLHTFFSLNIIYSFFSRLII